MRLSKFIFLILVTTSCSRYEELNKQIFEEQKKHITNSPYDDATGTFDHIKAQLEFRSSKLPELLNTKLSEFAITDTVYLMEDYDHICYNCPTSRMQILVNNQILNFRTNNNFRIDTVAFNLDSTNWNYLLQYAELLEIRKMELASLDWTTNTLKFGTNSCFDGNHTFVTAIYPSGQLKTVYARCWIPEIQRN